MEPIIKRAKQFIERAILDTYPQLNGKCPVIMVMPASPKIEVPADYTCTSAMALNKILSQLVADDTGAKMKTNPIEIAESISKNLSTGGSVYDQFSTSFENVTVTKPGFINFQIKKDYACDRVMDLIHNGVHVINRTSGRVIVDYSSPNIAKEMHVGHLRSTIIGDCVARLLEYANYDVLRLNHIGDWGTQFGMLLALLFERFGTDYTKFTN